MSASGASDILSGLASISENLAGISGLFGAPSGAFMFPATLDENDMDWNHLALNEGPDMRLRDLGSYQPRHAHHEELRQVSG